MNCPVINCSFSNIRCNVGSYGGGGVKDQCPAQQMILDIYGLTSALRSLVENLSVTIDVELKALRNFREAIMVDGRAGKIPVKGVELEFPDGDSESFVAGEI